MRHLIGKLTKETNNKTNQNRRSTMKTLCILLTLSVIAMLALTGCGDKAVNPTDDVVNNENNYDNDYNNDNESGEEDNYEDNNNNDDQLNFYEEQLLGLWSRYHAYDGSTMYVYFNADRTACKWEEEYGSNYRRSKSSYSHWYIDENNVNNGVATVVMNNGSFTYHFDYPADEVWPLGYTNLTYYPSSGKVCE